MQVSQVMVWVTSCAAGPLEFGFIGLPLSMGHSMLQDSNFIPVSQVKKPAMEMNSG